MSYIPDIGLQKYDYIVDMPDLYIIIWFYKEMYYFR